jgi:spore coat protein U-like protein
MKINNVRSAVLGVAGVACAFGLAAKTVSAASATANLAVSATVTNNCTISTLPLVFTPYDPVVANASTNLDGTGTVVVACTKGTAPTVGLGLGANAASTVRRMHDGSSNYLTYELYNDSGRSTVWTNAGLGLLSPVAAPSKAARSFTVYGRVPSNQDVPAGSYTDTVVATVNF